MLYVQVINIFPDVLFRFTILLVPQNSAALVQTSSLVDMMIKRTQPRHYTIDP
jgi:hypothetical protein